jgi:hypothetical protein
VTKFPDVAAADHWILTRDPVPAVAGTVFDRPHVAVVLSATDGARAVVFPGSASLTGSLTVAEVLSATAIDRVEVLGGTPADPDARLDTGDYVRPIWRDGELVLPVMPAAGGRLVPFETRNPTPCCADHA